MDPRTLSTERVAPLVPIERLKSPSRCGFVKPDPLGSRKVLRIAPGPHAASGSTEVLWWLIRDATERCLWDPFSLPFARPRPLALKAQRAAGSTANSSISIPAGDWARRRPRIVGTGALTFWPLRVRTLAYRWSSGYDSSLVGASLVFTPDGRVAGDELGHQSPTSLRLWPLPGNREVRIKSAGSPRH